MAVVQVDTETLRQMLEGMIRNVIQGEFLKLKLSMLPVVSDQEMEEIDNAIGAPGKYEEEEFETLEL
ncbi:MAG: hypothetical protein GY757_18335 [bacterium]|nr:hypothetical protein [bacterium]